MSTRQKIRIATLILALCFATEAFANIVMRAAVVNPSSVQKRKVPFRFLLPKEIKPEHVVDMGELEIAYDAQAGAYYVFKEYELEPKQTVLVEIEMQDVWKISQTEIDVLRDEAVKLAKVLSLTDYAERGSYLKDTIETKLAQIEETQRIINPNPGGYISDYRDNLKLLDQVKADLAAAKSLVAEARNIQPIVTWRLIFIIVGFLGLLGIALFVIWHIQMKSMDKISQEMKEAEEASRPLGAAEEGERRQVKEETKKSDISDIEKRLKS